ncbi:DUF3060 domain-containing protein, partial [Mycobacterium sp.]|uniref:DUF3060 domain-containing protein n=1 Tax=Mycobacterium sp. TaxID=1785 RepID=UPI0025E4B956
NQPYAAGPPYASGGTYTGGSPYAVGFPSPPRRRRTRYPWFLVLIVLGMLVPAIVSLVAHFARSNPVRNFGNGSGATVSISNPTAVPQGGELRVGSDSSMRTIACNDGKLTLYGDNTTYVVTGHCAVLTAGGYNNKVTVDSADTLEATGYDNTVKVNACSNGKLTLSAYGMNFDVTGHCASLAISSYDNHVNVDSVDTINVSGYDNVVIYQSGAPRVTNSGRSNTIQKG